ncbi:response regulator [Alloacidobacterium dinghuense]|uniref:histidine kinase n=1 Tax=Alloacidobacterium dinghuense TaxID=2763107 RepID=A0A7G8BKX0_9BACT|nr:ATP-binding protein [Alloacidobacterium dinghuense]QNI33190.1 response regulator [Alloacidobacterium dinghuense]
MSTNGKNQPIGQERPRESTGPNQKVNILLVDDQPAKLLSYEAILGELGENLIKAASGTEALEHLLKANIAVVLTDVSMPGIDGFELADMMRQHPRFQKTPILFISAIHLSDLDRIKGYERGAVDYISVPVVPEVLRAKVSVFAELHRKRLELENLNQELEQRVAERTEELRERADLLDLASEAITVRNMDGTLRFWSAGAEDLYGWKREEIFGKSVHEVLSTKFPVPFSKIEASLHETGRWEGNLTQRTRDGQEITVACRKALKTNKAGSPVAILEISRDITATLRAEQGLRNAEKLAAMGRVAGIIAHEINNPLEAILNIFHLLRNHTSLDVEALEYAQLAEKELLRVAHIVKHTLSFYREAQQPIAVSISEALDNVLELQSRNIQLQGITLEKRYLTEGTVQGFPGELRQVFMNLVGNAIQAMPHGGRLRIIIREYADSKTRSTGVSVSVCDTGSGIKPEHAKQLFEPFFTTKSMKGTGLGLWISKGIVHKYDGAIQFRSVRRSDMSATCFRVVIPGQIPSQRPKADVA